jgi:AraC-like DNA-binding protein
MAADTRRFPLVPPRLRWRAMVAFSHIGQVATPATFHPSHQHDVWELVLYTSGTGAITVGDQPVPFSLGTIVCLPPHVPHFERSPAGYTNFFLIFSQFTPPAPGIPVFSDDSNRSFHLLCMQLLKEFNLRQEGWQGICDGLADLLMRYLDRWAAAVAPAPEADQLRHLLVEHMHEPGFTVGDAMASLSCSSDHARRVFQRVTGATPSAYLTNLRIQAAKRLLAAGALVHEAGEQVGLPDPYYFSRVFRRCEGVSPVRYQQSRLGARRQPAQRPPVP